MRSLGPEADASYHAKIAAETEIYRNFLEVHKLPEIFHYWSNRYVQPKLRAHGFSTPDEMFRMFVEKQFKSGKKERRIASIGAGNCDLEVDLAAYLVRNGHDEFVIDCLDLNRDMLERGRAAAVKASVDARVNFLPVDLNAWSAAHEYDAILANQSLHHVLNLENLFAQVKRSLKPGGAFVISDIIGRNGHQRWPEALELVSEFWRKLPPSYRFNQSLLRYEEMYQNWDCSGEGFEGIRAQDILPLLLEQFHFELFIPFANIIDPFVDRAFGSNFDASAAWDRSFIDAVHERDEKEMVSGQLKPTHMLAVVGTDSHIPTRFQAPLSPAYCLRDPARPAARTAGAVWGSAYEWGSWPHDDRRELQIACARLHEAQEKIGEQLALVVERTEWARRLDLDIEAAARRIRELEGELERRTAWAQGLDSEVQAAGTKIEELHQELNSRTAWVERLQQERDGLALLVQERTGWAHGLEAELTEAQTAVEHLDREVREQASAHRAELERLAWARSLDWRFHGALDRGYRMIRGIFQFARRFRPGSRL